MIVCVDLDGCMAKYDVWRGQRHIGGPPPGVVDMVNKWVGRGWRVIVFTCRCSSDGREQWGEGLSIAESVEIVTDWLKKWGFAEEVEVWSGGGKPFADVYLDDKAVRVNLAEDLAVWGKDLDRLLVEEAKGK